MKALAKQLTSLIEESQPDYILFGIIVLFELTFFYYYMTQVQAATSLLQALKLVGIFLCSLIVLKDFWPKKLLKALPLFWYFTLIFCLPFYSAYYCLTTYLMPFSTMNYTIMVTLTIVLLGISNGLIVSVLGTLAAILTVFLTNVAQIRLAPSLANYEILYHEYWMHERFYWLLIWMVIIMLVFSRNLSKQRENYRLKEQIDSMKVVAASVAHELRTPLATMLSCVEGINRFLPQLVNGYEIAKKEKLINNPLQERYLDAIKKSTYNAANEVKTANTTINMLLINLTKSLKKEEMETCSMEKCLYEAISRYPYKENQRQLIEVDVENDFNFLGIKLFVVHVIFNLLKNSFYAIEAAEKGKINIKLSNKNHKHSLVITDTGIGMSQETVSKIFDQFYTNKKSGTGIGLSFCKAVIEKFGGNINCQSLPSHSTTFTINFPKITIQEEKPS